MANSTNYKVNISRRGPPPRPFGWELRRHDDAGEVERSADTFRSRHEAIADGERAAAARHERDGSSPPPG